MKKQLWICEREPKYFENLEPAKLNMIAKFPFTIEELELLKNVLELKGKILDYEYRAEKEMSKRKQVKKEYMALLRLEKEIQKLIEELKK